MFDRFVDLFLQFLDGFKFATVVSHWERGIVLRLGRFHREIKPGFHLVWPLWIEEVITEGMAITTTNLPAQSVTTKCGQAVTVAAVVTWKVSNVRKLILDVDGRQEPVLDACAGAVARAIAARDWAELHGHEADVATEITKAVHRRAMRYGVDVLEVQFTDLVKCRGLRLWAGPGDGRHETNGRA